MMYIRNWETQEAINRREKCVTREVIRLIGRDFGTDNSMAKIQNFKSVNLAEI